MMSDVPAQQEEGNRLPAQVVATPESLDLIRTLSQEHGPLVFYQSGGCCEGSAPMCFPEGEFYIGSRDVKLGEIGGFPFYISAQQFEYWKHTQLIIDVIPGFGAAFSLEGSKELAFHNRSRVFSDNEINELREAGRI